MRFTRSHRLGIEGIVRFKRETNFDPDNYCISIPTPGGSDVVIAVFDKVMVNITVEKDKNTQRGVVKMKLIKPIDSSGL